MNHPTVPPPRTLAIALGANIPSQVGSPIKTLITVRAQIEKIIEEWLTPINLQRNAIKRNNLKLRFRWSELFKSTPIKGSPDQPDFINAVVIIDGGKLIHIKPCQGKISNLLEKFLKLEKQFGREKKSNRPIWGPRPIDIDLLAWGDLQVNNKNLKLPHPRLIERDFVLIPLANALAKDGNTHPKMIKNQIGWQV
tara:strand:+ start:757 stop:1341 length:585 start_codon:yes stop_codon:yes gene_type:complete